MYSRVEKQFRNTAPSPVTVTAVALVGDTGTVAEVLATGGSFPESDAARAEATRMWHWIRTNFPGQDVTFFQSHNGIVPAPSFAEPERRTVNVVNTIDFPNLSSPDFAARLAKHIMRKNPELNPRAKALHGNYADAPKVGTYWQDKNRPLRYFRVISNHECHGHTHVRMLRMDRGGEYEWPFQNTEQWDKMFLRVSQAEAEGRTVGMPPELGMPYGEAMRVPFDELELRWHAIPTEEAERLVEQYRNAYPEVSQFFRDMLGGVAFEGNEVPPAPGERYHSYISNKTYTVIAVVPKRDSTDYDVLMERDGDQHRTKFTFRDHATWLSVWRPLDDEGQPRKVVEVEVKLDTKAATDALRDIGDKATSAAEAGRRFHEAFEAIDDSAVFDLVRVFDELHRRLPGWDEKPTSGPVLNQTDLAIRAIRTLVKHAKNYQQLGEAMRVELGKAHEHAGEQLRTINFKNRKIAELEERQRSGYWDAERVRREQDSTRELVRLYSKLFARHHGMQCAKDQLIALNASSLAALPPEAFMQFVTRCEEYSHRVSSNEG